MEHEVGVSCIYSFLQLSTCKWRTQFTLIFKASHQLNLNNLPHFTFSSFFWKYTFSPNQAKRYAVPWNDRFWILQSHLKCVPMFSIYAPHTGSADSAGSESGWRSRWHEALQGGPCGIQQAQGWTTPFSTLPANVIPRESCHCKGIHACLWSSSPQAPVWFPSRGVVFHGQNLRRISIHVSWVALNLFFPEQDHPLFCQTSAEI